MVEPWIAGLWAAIDQEFARRKDNTHRSDKSASLNVSTESNSIIDAPMSSLMLEDLKVNDSISSNTTANAISVPRIPDPLPSLSQSARSLSQSALSIPALPPEYLEVQFQESSAQVKSPMLHNCAF